MVADFVMSNVTHNCVRMLSKFFFWITAAAFFRYGCDFLLWAFYKAIIARVLLELFQLCWMIWRKTIDKTVFLKNSLSLRSEWNLQSFPSWMILKGQTKRKREEGEVLRNYNIYMCPLHGFGFGKCNPLTRLPQWALKTWTLDLSFSFCLLL